MKAQAIVVLCALIILAMFFFTGVSIQQGIFPIGSIGPIALAPQKAAQDMLNNRGAIQNFTVVKAQPWAKGQIVAYNDDVLAKNTIRSEFGYALVELRAGGWSVYQSDLHEILPSPAKIAYSSIIIDNQLVIYGRVSDPQIKTIEALTTNVSQPVQASIINNGFLIVVPHAKGMRELHTINQHGQVIEIFNQSNMFQP